MWTAERLPTTTPATLPLSSFSRPVAAGKVAVSLLLCWNGWMLGIVAAATQRAATDDELDGGQGGAWARGVGQRAGRLAQHLEELTETGDHCRKLVAVVVEEVEGLAAFGGRLVQEAPVGLE